LIGGALASGVVASVGLMTGPDDEPTKDSPKPRPGRAVERPAPPSVNPIMVENQKPGTTAWHGQPGDRIVTDHVNQAKIYASAASVGPGERLSFHVSVATPGDYHINVYRFGHYGGAAARKVATSGWLPGSPQPVPAADALGTIQCEWPVGWSVDIPDTWQSGCYLAQIITRDHCRNSVPFVVRAAEPTAALLVITPFTTYQAYNLWPNDKARGKSLYYGVEAGAYAYGPRARRVSFDRPFADDGLPRRFDRDQLMIAWMERHGYDTEYATSLDLHAGRVDPTAYRAVVFTGHDEYWSAAMRTAVESAIIAGTSALFMTANNIYWRVRFDVADPTHRLMTCYKTDPDPVIDELGGTSTWRTLNGGHRHAEQGVLGVQYNGIVPRPVPLVVTAPDHWFWAGTQMVVGDQVPNLVAGEADGWTSDMPMPRHMTHTLLSGSPYRLSGGEPRMQNTSIVEHANGAIVFDAATFDWSYALTPGHPNFDARIDVATKNLFNRVTNA
jgi:N,N-dimethylformamidase beta subunit-like, C-terminal